MASINRCLKEGMNARCGAPGSVGKKGGDADERAPRCSERGRGWESADRRALPRSERAGRGRSTQADRGGAGLVTRPRARCGRGVGSLAANGLRPGVSAGENWARVWGWAIFGVGGKIKRKLFNFYEL